MKKFKTILMVLALTMFSIQIAFAQSTISGLLSGCTTCHGGDAAGVTLTLSSDASKNATTTIADGTYSFTEVANGIYTVTPSIAGQAAMGLVFEPTSQEVTVEDTNMSANFRAVEAEACVPDTTVCSAASECGVELDSCNNEIECDNTCGSGETCNNDNNLCVPEACTPVTECTAGFECGVDDDGCGGTINCGTCGSGDSCVENICAPPVVDPAFLPGAVYLLLLLDDETCVDEIPATECTAGFECGVEDDGCGGTINCGTCGSGDSCVENICEACTPVKECLTWFECGVTNDGCSGTIDCGTCGTGESCVANICEAECTPATECTAGFNCGEEDDGCGGTLDCGTCSGENTCVENICRDVNLAEIIVGYCEEVARDTGEAIDELDEAYRDLEDCFGEYDDCQSGISDGNPLTCLQDYVECLDRGVDELESACSDFNRELTNATNSAFEEAAQHGLEDEFIQFLYSPAGEVCLAAAKEINLLCAEMFSN